MRKSNRILIVAVGLSLLTSHAHAARTREEIKAALRWTLQVDAPSLATPGQPRLTERLENIRNMDGLTRSDIQDMLLEMIEEDLSRSIESGNAQDSYAARGPLYGLTYYADHESLETLIRVAELAPEPMEAAASRAAVFVAARTAPERLQAITRQLLQKNPEARIFDLYAQILRDHLPEDPSQRQRVKDIMLQILRDAALAPSIPDKSHLDNILLTHDASYRDSSDRRRILEDLSRSSNAFDRKYGTEQLASMSRPTAPQREPSKIVKHAVSTAELPSPSAAAPQVADSPRVNWLPWVGIFLVVAATAALARRLF